MCVAFLALVLNGCNKVGGGDVSLVKNGYLDFDKSITLGQALDGYKFFSKKEWKAYKTEQGRRVVEFVGEHDLNNPEFASSKEKFSKDGIMFQFVINNDDTYVLNGGKLLKETKDGKNEDVDVAQLAMILKSPGMTIEHMLGNVYANKSIYSFM